MCIFFYLAVCDEFPKQTAQNTLKEQFEKASGLKGVTLDIYTVMDWVMC